MPDADLNEPIGELLDEAALAKLQHWLRQQDILNEIAGERRAQDAERGEQNWPLGTSHARYIEQANRFRRQCDHATEQGTVTWFDILREEVYEFAAEADPAKARVELIQVAAVATAIVEFIDRMEAARAQ